MKIRFYLLTMFALFIKTMTAQYELKGRVIDESTKTPLAFVNILVDQKIGATTNIDGLFSINSSTSMTTLKLSYVGYEIKEIEIIGKTSLIISLKPISYQLNEFTLFSGENPAHRIIKKVVENRIIHNPEKSLNFKYESYNKLFITGAIDSSIINNPEKLTDMDSSSQKALEFLEKHHVFLMESVTERKYMLPDKSYEKVLASRVSGLQNNTFSVIATEIQSFSFYDELITVAGNSYLNPISLGSINKYFFLIEDTTFNDFDTVYIISFQPKKGKNFKGLKGLLYINTDGYAVQNVVAEPCDESELFAVKIQQQYKKIEGSWFPIQLNTTILFKTASVNNIKMLGVGKSYLKNIEINPELKKQTFGIIATEVADDVTKKDEEFWNRYREDTLSDKEKLTYHFIDSVGKVEKFDKKLGTIETLLSGKLKWGYIDVDFNRFIRFNDYEGFRFGSGVHTNSRISKRFNLGGYVAYGTKDKAIKYGGDINLFIHRQTDIELNLSYQKDVVEPGITPFYSYKTSLFSPAAHRFFYISQMNVNEKIEARLKFRTARYLTTYLFLNHETIDITNDYYYFKKISDNVWLHDQNYLFNEVGVEFKYAFKQKVIQSANFKYTKPANYPIVYARVEHGFNNSYGEYVYTRITLKSEKTFEIKNIGKPSIQLESGAIIGDAPIQKLNNAAGIKSPSAFKIVSEFAFETMLPYEFYADKFAYLFFKHNFGSLLFKTKKFKPEVALATNFGIGTLSNQQNHGGIKFNTMERGFCESGILLNNILKLNFTSFGVAAYYRYGYYKFPIESDNFTIKMSVSYSF